jgi:uncharacterized protein involved in response to NO
MIDPHGNLPRPVQYNSLTSRDVMNGMTRRNDSSRRFALFDYGFRPHFLFAGIAALVLVPAWALNFVFGVSLSSDWPATLWHAHEMLFGFIASAVAGFLLTAVPGWTGRKGFAGWPLMLLTALWLAARVMIASSSFWPRVLTAAVDLSFFPALAVLVGLPLLRSRNRNTPLLLVLSLLWLTNLAFHIALIHRNSPSALHAILIGIDLMLVLVTVIGGRIVPAFTATALRSLTLQESVTSRSALTIGAVAAMAAVTVGDVFVPDGQIAGALAAIAAVVQAWRLTQWRTLKTLRQPIVWVLHLAYLWLPVGLGLKAIALLSGAAFSAFWLHALTIGVLSMMILAVMTRASLGHTGRPLVVRPVTTVSYFLLAAAAIVRVFGLATLRVSYPAVIGAAALLWTAAFLLFTVVYAPILCRPRVDGKPG